jgi:hypothetical protein
MKESATLRKFIPHAFGRAGLEIPPYASSRRVTHWCAVPWFSGVQVYVCHKSADHVKGTKVSANDNSKPGTLVRLVGHHRSD